MRILQKTATGKLNGRKRERKEGREGGREKREKGKSSLNKLGVSFFSTCKKSRSRKLRAGPQLHDAIGIQAPISFHSAILLCSSLWVPRWALHLPTVCPCSCWKKVKIEGKGAKMLKPAKSVLLLRVFLEVLLNNFCYHHRIENMIALFCKEDWEIWVFVLFCWLTCKKRNSHIRKATIPATITNMWYF